MVLMTLPNVAIKVIGQPNTGSARGGSEGKNKLFCLPGRCLWGTYPTRYRGRRITHYMLSDA